MAVDEVKKLKIEDLTPFVKHIEVYFQVISKEEPRDIFSRRSNETHRLCEVTVADSTGAIILSLWDNDIDLVEEEETYTLSNGYVVVHRNSMRLSKGKFGVLLPSDENIEHVDTFNNLSDRFVEGRQRSRHNTYQYGSNHSRRDRYRYSRTSDRYRDRW
ncbi:MAG: hypothetical protein ACFFBD_12490 [Candidatus Hodarchaeota archaeon]